MRVIDRHRQIHTQTHTHRLRPIYSSATIICEDLFFPQAVCAYVCILKATMDIKGMRYYRCSYVNYNNNSQNNGLNCANGFHVYCHMHTHRVSLSHTDTQVEKNNNKMTTGFLFIRTTLRITRWFTKMETSFIDHNLFPGGTNNKKRQG